MANGAQHLIKGPRNPTAPLFPQKSWDEKDRSTENESGGTRFADELFSTPRLRSV
ncbi:MAG: hypothetical protein ABSB78_01985 [Bacteroidota bacterium]